MMSDKPTGKSVVPDTQYTTTTSTGLGAETHQVTHDKDSRITTQLGVPIADNQNSLRLGARGPVLLEDFILRDKIMHFDHERIPERVVHARGVGAHGYFETYESLSEITRADLFQRAGEKTPVFVRFSTVLGSKGSMDLARDVRGFAVKFYTKEGNWDLVGNNIPVFFIQDAMKFPDLVHAGKQEPDRAFPQAQTAHDNFWDFISLTPESTHMIMWAMSDRAIPRSYRFMEGFGVHTFRLVNKDGESKFVKFMWKPKLGMQSVLWNEAVKINGADPDFHRRDLWEALTGPESPSQPQEATPTNKKKPSKCSLPEWELHLQVFDEATALKMPFDVLDPTKLIPEELVNTLVVGRLVLERPVDNHFQETEQAAFCTANIVPGIDFTNDPLLQGRNFSYPDVQLTRLGGPNWTHIPINMPGQCPVLNFHQDGFMSIGNPKSRVNYEPNSWSTSEKKCIETGKLSHSEAARESPETGFKSYAEPAGSLAAGGGDKMRARSELFADHYSQARLFYYSQTLTEQRHILDAFTFELGKVRNPEIRKRMISNLLNVDTTLAQKVALNLGIDVPSPSKMAKEPIMMKPSDPLSILKMAAKNQTFAGRKLGVVITNGSDAGLLKTLREAVEGRLGGMVTLVGPTGTVTLSNKDTAQVDEQLPGGPSVLFDAIAILPGELGVGELHGAPQSIADFIWDAFYHCKFIGYNVHALRLFSQIGFDTKIDAGCFNFEVEGAMDTYLKKLGEQRQWDRENTIRS